MKAKFIEHGFGGIGHSSPSTVAAMDLLRLALERCKRDKVFSRI